MIIGSLSEDGNGATRFPAWFLDLKKRKRRQRHTAEELAEATGMSKSAILRGFDGLIEAEVVREGRQSFYVYLDDDLKWLENEVAEGRIYPVRVDRKKRAKQKVSIHQIAEELVEACKRAESVGQMDEAQTPEQFMATYKETQSAVSALGSCLEKIMTLTSGDPISSVASAGLTLSKLSKNLGESEAKFLRNSPKTDAAND